MEKPAVGENRRSDADDAGEERAFSVESGQLTERTQEYNLSSAHVVDNDSWRQVGVLLVTSFNCAYILSFSNLMMVPLGWVWGAVCLLAIGAFAFYANWLLSGFQVIDGRRFLRYRDIMGFVFDLEDHQILIKINEENMSNDYNSNGSLQRIYSKAAHIKYEARLKNKHRAFLKIFEGVYIL